MVKRKSQPIISSESSSDSEFGSDLDMELLSLAKKKKTSRLASNSPRVEEFSDSSDSSDDDSEPEASMQCMKRETKQQQQAESGSSSSEDSDDESGSSSSDSESSYESENEKMGYVIGDRVRLVRRPAVVGSVLVRRRRSPGI
ncbi:hypothetical protein RP20_CCG006210 [Aedes albopictus]|nr:hypothetical protein RP20_CCG006210 [Aedes albopictus]